MNANAIHIEGLGGWDHGQTSWTRCCAQQKPNACQAKKRQGWRCRHGNQVFLELVIVERIEPSEKGRSPPYTVKRGKLETGLQMRWQVRLTCKFQRTLEFGLDYGAQDALKEACNCFINIIGSGEPTSPKNGQGGINMLPFIPSGSACWETPG